MSEKGLTNISLKKINKSKVYQYIYRKKTTSKLQIVQELQMGLSTVSQNLNLLEQEGLIEKNGFFESTGGRKANALQIVSDFKISIGIGILKEMFHITAVDLYGNAFYTDTIPLPYSNTPDYYKQVTDAVRTIHGDSIHLKVELIDKFETYYRDMSRMYRDRSLLPVWKITVDDPDHSCYYIHPETATVRYVNSTARWKYWMYTALHRLRIQGLNSSPTLRKSVLWVLLLGGTVCSLSGVVLGVRYIERKCRKKTRR